MKKFSLIFFGSLLLFVTANSQELEWAKSIGGTDRDLAYCLTVDNFGNVYTVGFFEDTVDFDPGPGIHKVYVNYYTNIFVQKLDSDGNFVWAKTMECSTGDGRAQSVTTDAAGNVYVTGKYAGTTDFDPGIGTYYLDDVSGQDIFILKLDSDGNFTWAKSIGSFGTDVGISIAVDDTGNVYTMGNFYATVDFDPGIDTFNLTSIGINDDIFILKLDVLGNFVWAKSFGGMEDDYAEAIVLDDIGGVYATGRFEGTADFDPGLDTFDLTQTNNENSFILKLNSAGSFEWAKLIDYSNNILVDSLNNVYVTGLYSGAADFDPGLDTLKLFSKNGSADSYVLKLDTNGDFLWVRTTEGTGHEFSYSSTIDNDGNVYTIGQYLGEAELDPGEDSLFFQCENEHWNIFIQKLNKWGTLIWAGSISGTFDGDNNYSYNFGKSIDIDNEGNIYATGDFLDVLDFDMSTSVYDLTSNGEVDFFIARYSDCTTTSMQSITTCFEYTAPDGEVYTNSGQYKAVIPNAAGCDSVITLFLTINKVNKTVITDNATLTADADSATFKWLDCENNYSIISNETNKSFTAANIGNYAVEITQNSCVDTSSCIEITSIAFIENSLAENIKIYPNPSNGIINIEVGSNITEYDISVRSLDGRLISQEHKTTSNSQININGNSGIYFLEINSDKGRAVLRVIKN